MTTNFHHGPEVIEHKDGVTIVRDVKSAVTYVNGTAPIGDVHDTAAERAKYINRRRIVRSVADAASYGPQLPGYTIPQALAAIFNKGAGGTVIVNNVYDPDTHQGDVANVTQNQIIGGIDANGIATGLSGMYECYSRFGYFPKIHLSAQSSDPAVRAAMQVIANKIHGHAVVDIPVGLTKQQAVETRGSEGLVNFSTSDPRLLVCYPHMVVDETEVEGTRLDPLSQHLAGVMIQTDLTQGYHHSPSNREMIDVLDMEVDINIYPGEVQNDADFLNEAGIVTAMNYFGSGIRTWGNRSAAFPTSTHLENFIHVRRIMDQLHEAAIFFTMQYTDKLGDRKNIASLEEGMNAFLRSKTGSEKPLYGARFYFDRARNTPAEIGDGRFHYTMELTPTSIMERITMHSYVDTRFIAGALNLVAA